MMKTGKVPENVLKRSVLRQIKTKRKEVLHGAGVGGDCAIFSFGGEEALASCVQEAQLAAGRESCPGEAMAMGDLIQKCVNNLAAGGARPVAVMIALFLPPEAEEPDIRRVMAEAEEKCASLSVEIAGGQTRITAAACVPMAVVTGYGRAPAGGIHGLEAAAPGQDIVLSKWIGLQGTAFLAKCHRTRLLARYPAWLVEEAEGFDRYLSILPEAMTAVWHGVCAMHDASEGGILGALWELAEGADLGLTVDMRKLPLRQETVEVCECCGVNPYELLSGGCLILTAWDGEGLKEALEAEGIPAAVVGKLTDSNDRILVNGKEIHYLDRPKRDAVYAEILLEP